jgi:hypothetical protein
MLSGMAYYAPAETERFSPYHFIAVEASQVDRCFPELPTVKHVRPNGKPLSLPQKTITIRVRYVSAKIKTVSDFWQKV